MNYADRVKETTTATSMATIALAGAAGGFRSFASALSVGTTGVPVCIADAAGNWEISSITITSAGLLTRESVLASSNGGAAVVFPAGTKDVFCTMPASAIAAGMVNPSDVGFDIVLCAGQSNMVGFGGTRDTLIDFVDSRVYQFGGYPSDAATYQVILNGADPLKMPLNDGALGPATAFAKAYANTIPTNRRVLLVPVAIGGTSVGGRWAPGAPGGDLYEMAISQSNAAITKAKLFYPNSRFVGAIWAQGESDSGSTQAAYAATLKAVIAGFRTRITGAANSFFIIAGMVPEGGKATIQAAHAQVAIETSRAWYVPGISGFTSDNLHYLAPGARIMGAALGLAVTPALAYFAVDNTAPTAATASVANGSPSVVSIAMSEPLDAASVPAASAFLVGGHTVTNVTVSGSTISLTCSAPFANGEAARTLSYTQPGANNVRDLAANLLANFTGLTITNSVLPVDTTPPAFNSAQVANGMPTLVVISMGEALAAVTPATSAFALSGGKTVSAVSVSGSTVTLTASAAYAYGDTITVSYTQPGANALQDAAGNQTVSFGPSSVANNIGAPATAPATMAAPTAVAGDANASITLVASSDGGSAITGYVVTSSPAGGVDSGSGTTSLTRTMTGLTNGTAYTFTAVAANAIGSSAASSASNSITPASATYIRMNTLTTGMTESGTGPYTYADSGKAYGSGGPFGGLTVQSMAADGSFAITISGANETMLGIRPGTTVVDYTGLPYAFYSNAGAYKPFTSGAGGTATNSVARAAGDIMRLRRTGSTLVAEVARAATPTTWTTIYTWTGITTASTRFQVSIGTGSGNVTALTGVGLV